MSAITAQPGKSTSGYVTRTRTSSLPVRVQEKEVSRLGCAGPSERPEGHATLLLCLLTIHRRSYWGWALP